MNPVASLLALGLLFHVTQIPAVPATEFSKEQQLQFLTATVRIRNRALDREGTGVLVGKSGPFVYVLTAHHVVQGGERLEVATFAKETYPRVKETYRSVEITAESPGQQDLALLRIRTTDAMPGFVKICPEAKIPNPSVMPFLTLGCERGAAPTPMLEKRVEKRLAQKPGSKEASAFWVIDGKYAAGRSGGPLLDKRGYLLGTCSGTNRDKTYFTHIDEIQRFLKRNGYRWLLMEQE